MQPLRYLLPVNPGVILGAVLGLPCQKMGQKQGHLHHIDISDARLEAWLEQLLAESTGKLGKGIVPVDLEPLKGAAGSIYLW